jgi:micrococcal nuclease
MMQGVKLPLKSKRVLSALALYVVFVAIAAVLIFTLYPSIRGIRVAEVIDGDTIVLNNKEVIRYIGIDTPEKGEPFYDEATEVNRNLVLEKQLRLEYDIDKQDRYGRTLAYVWVDTILVNARLLGIGLASIYTFVPNVKHINRFIWEQKEARETHLGIWSIEVAGEEYYLASGKSERFVFHRPDCQWATRIKEENLIRFSTRDEVLDSGYSPCRTCKP